MSTRKVVRYTRSLLQRQRLSDQVSLSHAHTNSLTHTHAHIHIHVLSTYMCTCGASTCVHVVQAHVCMWCKHMCAYGAST